MHKHEWHEPAGDDGKDTRYVRAMFHAGRWTFEETLKSQEVWHTLPSLALADLETLVVLLRNKYQRKRVPHSHVLYVEKLIEEARERETSP